MDQELIERCERDEKLARDMIEVGKAYIKYPDLPPRHPNRAKIHVRGIVDDDIVVYRRWSQAKRRWYYATEHMMILGMMIDNGQLKRA